MVERSTSGAIEPEGPLEISDNGGRAQAAVCVDSACGSNVTVRPSGAGHTVAAVREPMFEEPEGSLTEESSPVVTPDDTCDDPDEGEHAVQNSERHLDP